MTQSRFRRLQSIASLVSICVAWTVAMPVAYGVEDAESLTISVTVSNGEVEPEPEPEPEDEEEEVATENEGGGGGGGRRPIERIIGDLTREDVRELIRCRMLPYARYFNREHARRGCVRAPESHPAAPADSSAPGSDIDPDELCAAGTDCSRPHLAGPGSFSPLHRSYRLEPIGVFDVAPIIVFLLTLGIIELEMIRREVRARRGRR